MSAFDTAEVRERTLTATELQEACQRVLAEHGARALQYGPTQGYRPLREMISRHTARYGISITPDQVLVTSGAQQALDLIGKVFINPGDHILVEEPTHVGALEAWQSYQAEYVGVPLDAEGIQTDLLEAALRSGPKLLYVLPNFHNPTGVTLSLARRLKLVALADQYGVPILEDDPYGQLRYAGEHIAPLAVLDGRLHTHEHLPDSGNVLYLSTFSQTLAPGLRLGWMIAPVDVMPRLVQAKQGADLQTSLFLQMVAYEVARGGFEVAFWIIMCASFESFIVNAVMRCSWRYATPSLLRRPGQSHRVASLSGSRCHRPSTPPPCYRQPWPPTWRLLLARRSLPTAEDST